MFGNAALNVGHSEKKSANDCSGVGQRDFAVGQRLLNDGQQDFYIGQRFLTAVGKFLTAVSEFGRGSGRLKRRS